MMGTREKGQCAEEIAALFLLLKGFSIIGRNMRSGAGPEIDIVAKIDATLVFAEVKFRESSYFGSPAVAVDWRKRKQILGAARKFMNEEKLEADEIRFDVVSILLEDGGLSLEHIEGAFGAG